MKIRPQHLCFALAFASAAPAGASTCEQYLALRTRLHCDRSLSYSQVQSRTSQYVGRVFEIRGTVGGSARSASGVTVMLNLPDHSAPILEVDSAEASLLNEGTTPTIRALVRVEDSSAGGVALKVVALARDSGVTNVEEAEQARERTSQARHSRVTISRAANQRHTRLAYRGMQFSGATSSAPAEAAAGLTARARPLFNAYYQFILGRNSRLDAAQAQTITYHLLNFADRYRVDPRLVVAMIIAESDFNPNARSHSGAMGLGQLMPGTAKSLGLNNAYDPAQNLNGSISYLRSRLDTFADHSAPGGGESFEQVSLAMAAYNAGVGAVKRFNGIPPYRETQAYVKRVVRTYQQLCGQP